jgi:hypothetical protein
MSNRIAWNSRRLDWQYFDAELNEGRGGGATQIARVAWVRGEQLYIWL